jgi:hypothetical protein
MSESVKKASKPIERVTVSEALKSKLQSLCDQANEALQGMATISKSDIMNLILDTHSCNLNKAEIDRLRNTHFDEVRFAQWMARRLKDARGAGEALTLMDLIERGKKLVSNPRDPTLKRQRRSKRLPGELSPESINDSQPPE